MGKNIDIDIGVPRRIGYKQAAGLLYYNIIPHLSYSQFSTIIQMMRDIYWMLQVYDLQEYRKHYLPTWEWLEERFANGDFKAITRHVCDAHLSSIGMSQLPGFGLASGIRTKGRMKLTGEVYSNPERFSIYPNIQPQTKWPKGLSKFKRHNPPRKKGEQ